eukprot:15333320-Ditylum_brightwellii.AAC.1
MPNKKIFADDKDEKHNLKHPHFQKSSNETDKMKFGMSPKGKDKGEWDLYQGVMDSAACPKHWTNHTSEACKHNCFKKLAASNKNKSMNYYKNQNQGARNYQN